jgi:hypothetical protein
VRITHPFHPLSGREFPLLDERSSRHGDRVWFRADDGVLRTVPRDWTSLAAADPFEVIAAGRAWFRPEDLAHLVALVSALRSPGESTEGGDAV